MTASPSPPPPHEGTESRQLSPASASLVPNMLPHKRNLSDEESLVGSGQPDSDKVIDVASAQEGFERRVKQRQESVEGPEQGKEMKEEQGKEKEMEEETEMEKETIEAKGEEKQSQGALFERLPTELFRIIAAMVGTARTLLDLASTSHTMREAVLPFALEKMTISGSWYRISHEASPVLVRSLIHWNPLLLLYPDNAKADDFCITIPDLPNLLTLEVRKPAKLLTGEIAEVTLPALNVIAPRIAAKAPPRLHHLSANAVLTDTIPNPTFELLIDAWNPKYRRVGEETILLMPLHDNLTAVTLSTSINKGLIEGRCLASWFQSLSPLPNLRRLVLTFDTSISQEGPDPCQLSPDRKAGRACTSKHLVDALKGLSKLEDLHLGFNSIFYNKNGKSCLIRHLVGSRCASRLTRLSVPFELCRDDLPTDDFTKLPRSRLTQLELTRVGARFYRLESKEVTAEDFFKQRAWILSTFDKFPMLQTLAYIQDKDLYSSGYGLRPYKQRVVISRSQAESPEEPAKLAIETIRPK